MKLKRATYWQKQEIRKRRSISKLKIKNYNLRRNQDSIGDIFALEINNATLSMLQIELYNEKNK